MGDTDCSSAGAGDAPSPCAAPANRPKPGPTGLDRPGDEALEVFLRWWHLQSDQTSQNAIAYKAMAEASRGRGNDAKWDRLGLRALVTAGAGGTEPGELKTGRLRDWLEARSQSLEVAFRSAGFDSRPILEITGSKGRNAAWFGLSMVPLGDQDGEEDQADEGIIVYRMQPGRPAWWLAPFLRQPLEYTPGKVPLRLVGLLLIPVSWFVALSAFVYLQITGVRWAIIGLGIALGLLPFVVDFLRTWRDLGRQRISVLSDRWLAWDQFHGQLRMESSNRGRQRPRISLVRHKAECIFCGSDVELLQGGVDFPGRVVGRCREAPLEHVFSFDPVALRGLPLRGHRFSLPNEHSATGS